MNTRLSHVVSTVYGRPWYVREEAFAAIDSIVRLHVAGGRLSDDEIRERLDAASARSGPRGGARQEGAIAVIPIYGMIFPKANLMTEISGGATVSGIRSSLRAALMDESVGSILLDVDSPGGYAVGIEELATEIRESRGRKPIVALAQYTMGSAAYYLGSQADEIVASPSSDVGWIGTVMVHQEFSKADEIDGVTTTIIRNPPGKYGGNQFEPLSDKARAEMQRVVDQSSAQFVRAVSKGRGVSEATVKSDFGQGGGMTAADAKAAGLVDRVATFDDTIARMAAGKVQTRGSLSAIVEPYLAATPSGDDTIRSWVYTEGVVGSETTETHTTTTFEFEVADDPESPSDRARDAEAALALAKAQAGR